MARKMQWTDSIPWSAVRMGGPALSEYETIRRVLVERLTFRLKRHVDVSSLRVEVGRGEFWDTIAADMTAEFLGVADDKRTFMCPHAHVEGNGHVAYLADLSDAAPADRLAIHRSHEALAILRQFVVAARPEWVPRFVPRRWWDALLWDLSRVVYRFLCWWRRELYPVDGPQPVNPEAVRAWIVERVRFDNLGHYASSKDYGAAWATAERLLARVGIDS